MMWMMKRPGRSSTGKKLKTVPLGKLFVDARLHKYQVFRVTAAFGGPDFNDDGWHGQMVPYFGAKIENISFPTTKTLAGTRTS